jgi:HEAT repeat protein
MRVLTQSLEDSDPVAVSEALQAFSTMGSRAQKVVPDLLAALKNPKESTRRAVLEAVGDIGPEASAAVPQLIASLDEPSLELRQSAVVAIGKIGPGSKAAVPAISALLSEPTEEELRISALRAIGNIGPGTEVPISAFEKALQDPSPGVRYAAIQALGNLGMAAIPAVPRLIEALKGSDVLTHTYAANSLALLARNAAHQRATETLNVFITALKAMQDLDDLNSRQATNNLAQSVALLNPGPTVWQHVRDWASSNPAWALVLTLYTIWNFVWILLFWCRSVVILRLNEALMSADFKLPAWLGGGTLPLRYILIIGFFGYHPRVLDSWVESVSPIARDRFTLKGNGQRPECTRSPSCHHRWLQCIELKGFRSKGHVCPADRVRTCLWGGRFRKNKPCVPDRLLGHGGRSWATTDCSCDVARHCRTRTRFCRGQ